jgi:hypothetical protein
MRAVYYEKFGSIEELKITDRFIRPIAKNKFLMVQVSAAGVNPRDAKLRSCEVSSAFLHFPKIPGSEFCGHVINKQENKFLTTNVQFEIESESKDEFNNQNRRRISEGDRVIGLMPLAFMG